MRRPLIVLGPAVLTGSRWWLIVEAFGVEIRISRRRSR